ncbi:YchJ family protein [Gordonia malaquae]|uniref:YchJ family protein n=1 Tax=Gordonia malaquae TaxID=410332 RepID=UPI0030C79395
MNERRCPCGSGETLAACCGRFLSGGVAPTAEVLMRSRFTAFAVGDREYLLDTWHPSTRPSSVDLDEGTRWLHLEIVDVVDGSLFDDAGIVEFTAVYRDADGRGDMTERSTFERVDGRWLYVSGVHR